MKKNHLDEMQERKMYQIGYNGYKIALFGLFGMLVIQQTVLAPGNLWQIAGELVVLLVLSVYGVGASIHNGIWERRIPATRKANLLLSLLTGAVTGLIAGVQMWQGFGVLRYALFAGFSTGLFTMLLCFVTLSGAMALYRRRREKLDQE